MNPYRVLRPSTEEIEILRGRVFRGEAVISFRTDPEFASYVAALGIHREIGGINDQLTDFLYRPDDDKPVSRDSVRSEIVEYRRHIGVRIWSEETDRLELRLRGGVELLHPTFSFHGDGGVRELVLFPESLAKIAALNGVELVVVREWALNTIFGGFDPTKRFYETNVWELVHNDTLRYSSLLAQRRIALLGTHDLTAHLAGIRRESIDELQARGSETHRRLLAYYGGMKTPSVYSLVLPYAAGVLLDDLAQVGNSGAPGRRHVFDLIMNAIDERITDPAGPRILARFPEAYEKLIVLARDPDLEKVKKHSPGLLRELVRELRRFSVAA